MVRLTDIASRLAVAALAAALILSACGDGASDDGKLQVVATTTQIGDFARNVGGDLISLTVLMQANQDAHDFEPAPSQLRALSRADVVLRNGIGLDTFVVKAIGAGSDAEAVIVSEGLTLREAAGEHEESDEEGADHEAAQQEAAGHDPHVWFSAANARTMVENIRDAFVAEDPANAETYRTNASRYLQELSALDSEIRSRVATVPPSCRKLVTNHDTLGYFAEAYGFTVVGSVIPSSSSEAQASAAGVAEIVRRVRSERVAAVFAETSINPALINQVGREAGVTVVDNLYGDSLGAAGSDGATYITMMRANTTRITDALKNCPF